MAFDVWNFPFKTAGLNRWHGGDPDLQTGPGGIYQKESKESRAKFPGGVLNKWDIQLAQDQGASNYQLKQLWLQAGRSGVHRDTKAGRNLWQEHGSIKSPWKFGNYGNWGMGMKDIYGMEGQGWDVDQVKGARDFAIQNRLNIGKGVDEHIQGMQEQVKKDLALSEWIAKAQDDVPDLAKDPPKPSFPGAGGHFVPGTTRLAGHKTPQKGRRSSIKSRFARTGEGFQSALSIGGSQGGGTAGSKSTLNLT